MTLTYTSDETQLSYRDTGNGISTHRAESKRAGAPRIPVVFLHPTPLDGEYWRPVVETLSQENQIQLRAIVPDLRGHGTSELGTRLPAGEFARVPDAPVLTMGQLASDVLALLDHLKLERAVFAGCSIGGYVLLELWRRAPERMLGLAFVCSKPQPDTEAGLAKRATTIAQARAGDLAALFDGFAQNLVGATAQAKRPEIVREVRARMTLTAEAEIAVQAGLAARPDSVPTVSSITVPVLAIAGGEDNSVTAPEMEAFCAAPGGCTYELLADAGHFAAYEQPDNVAELTSAWLGQL